MKFLSNAHTHTKWCDGSASAKEMIAEAEKLGFVSLGFSGHANQGFDKAYSMADGRQDSYLEELRALQQERLRLNQRPRLWVGLELDAMASEECRRDAFERFDYVIGSAHYMSLKEGSNYGCDGNVSVDGPCEPLKRYVEEELDGDGLALVRRYYKLCVNALLRDRPAIIGHFDLVRKNAASARLFDEDDPAYRALALDALERARACGGVLEINTGGMARYRMRSAYPTKELLGAWHEMGGDVTITSDCHNPVFLSYGLDQGMEMARECGFERVLRLGAGDALWEDISLR